MNKHLEELKEVAKSDNLDEIKAKTTELEKASGEIFTKLYQAASQNAGQAEGDGIKVEDMGENNQ